MATKNVGDYSEALVRLDLLKRGYIVANVEGDNAPYDLIVDKNGELLRVQVKARTPVAGKLGVELYTMVYDSTQSTNNRSKQKKYSEASFDWIAVVDISTETIYYVPMDEVCRYSQFTLRLRPSRQQKNVRFAESYTEF